MYVGSKAVPTESLSGDAAEMKAHQGKGVEPQQVNTPDDDFQVIGEPLYGGKGKSSGLI